MGIFKDYANHLRQFTVERQEADLFEIFKSHEAAILDFNIQQLRDGRDAFGKFITPPYTERTKEIKKSKGQPFDRVTTEDEGDFHRNFYIESSKFPATFTSSDFKTGFLVEKYGDLFGLDETSTEALRSGYTNEDIGKYYREKVFHL